MIRKMAAAVALACTLIVAAHGSAAPESGTHSPHPGPQRVTILVDAFGTQPGFHQDWGYAALIEYGVKRILFDTGNDSNGFLENVQRAGVDLTRLDAVVISHRHGDHTAGLRHLLRVNPRVRIYVPNDEAFGGPTPPVFFRQPDPALPAAMRYFGGSVPEVIPHGSAWPEANFILVDSATQIVPGFRVVRNISSTQQFSETPELSLVIDTPRGQVLVVGCSHPGIERIVASVAARDPRIFLIAGGLHLVTTPQAEVERVARALHDEWNVERIAPGHCTGEMAFAILQRIFGGHYGYAGVGTVIDLS